MKTIDFHYAVAILAYILDYENPKQVAYIPTWVEFPLYSNNY